jgi:hypothetical protein
MSTVFVVVLLSIENLLHINTFRQSQSFSSTQGSCSIETREDSRLAPALWVPFDRGEPLPNGFVAPVFRPADSALLSPNKKGGPLCGQASFAEM